MFFDESWTQYYSLVVVLQILCILHCLKTGRKEWIYLLIFLPLVGCIVYFVREIMPGFSAGNAAENVQRTLFPNFKSRELEHRLRVADTDANRMMLADEYARQKQYGRAIELTNACAQGLWANDPDLLFRLGKLYFHNAQYAESLASFNKALPLRNPGFSKSDDELIYARVLEATGNTTQAEEEYKKVIRVHHSMEARYHYGKLLQRLKRNGEAVSQFQAVLNEKDLHPKYVRRMNYQWIQQCKRELSAHKKAATV
ncbi:hypothetical protein HNQ91_003078 [Filimonas zeae]|uniref:Tetratricopeptide repeat protein n=1 Tax=Filimonas zeae TaxID=1737353 RepID=A0A917MWI5_9BACT|nr:tetratricopeptide repeat protein [Filimonas zeae]MDR6340013.1 hypothetical protein [Filimonas zeae]GGH70730.1 hypothetical protein GCM10011379_29310 [Filimonas zeae]